MHFRNKQYTYIKLKTKYSVKNAVCSLKNVNNYYVEMIEYDTILHYITYKLLNILLIYKMKDKIFSKNVVCRRNKFKYILRKIIKY
jgi:hypothetical protein